MNKRLTSLLAAAMLPACLTTTAIGEVTAERMDEIVAALKSDAEAWVADEPAGGDAAADLGELTYDADIVPLLRGELRRLQPTAEDIYVANRLLAPLTDARTEVIADAVRSLQPLVARLARYAPLPEYSKRQLEAAAENPQLAEQKLQRDRRVQKQNAQAHKLEMQMFRLMVFADERRYDMQLVREIAAREQAGRWSFAEVLEIVRDEAKNMPRDRAKTFYEQLARLGNALRYHPTAEYADPSKITIAADANPKMDIRHAYPGIRILQVVNQLATAARQPALKVPTPAEVDKANEKR